MIGPPMPVPNHSAANGTQAIGRDEAQGIEHRRDDLVEPRNQPISSPSGTPTAAASRKP